MNFDSMENSIRAYDDLLHAYEKNTQTLLIIQDADIAEFSALKQSIIARRGEFYHALKKDRKRLSIVWPVFFGALIGHVVSSLLINYFF